MKFKVGDHIELINPKLYKNTFVSGVVTGTRVAHNQYIIKYDEEGIGDPETFGDIDPNYKFSVKLNRNKILKQILGDEI